MGRIITLIPGDGIGPEVTNAAKRIIDAAGLDIDWDIKEAGSCALNKYGTLLPEDTIESIKKNKVALKGPITTPIGTGFRSINVTLRQMFKLYANVRPIKTYKGVPSRYDDIDIVVVRENTEDLYSGIEHMVGDDAAESIKIITGTASRRIAEFAFNYAEKENRKKVTAVHKANIMKLSDGLFLKCVREIAEKHKSIKLEEMIVDAMCMRLVLSPENYDVLVLPNLYGDIVSDLAAGLIGGLGLAPGANIGTDAAIFEPVHGSAPDIAGQNIANPTAAILSSVMMLRYIGEYDAADKIEVSVKNVLSDGKYVTKDLGGNSTTSEYTDEIIRQL